MPIRKTPQSRALRDRHDRAVPLFQSALEALPTNKKAASLRAEAVWYLEERKAATEPR